MSLSRAESAWHYARPLSEIDVELGTVRGIDVGLPVHFHDEDQITFVLSGQRRFVIENQRIEVRAGEGTRIPAGTPHSSLPEDAQLFCINIYTPAGEDDAAELVGELAREHRRRGRLDASHVLRILEEQCAGWTQSTAVSPKARWLRQQQPSVSEAARLSGVTREAFSRRFRRLHGLPPQAFHLLARLNEARRMLRRGDAIVDVAAQTGFADQSHLGRLFRRAFGITPGRYRAG